MAKDNYVQVRVNQDQEEVWRKCAEGDGTSLSAWMRNLMDWCALSYYEQYEDPTTHEVKYRRKQI